MARPRFFVQFRRVVDEHLLLSRRDAKNTGLQDPGARTVTINDGSIELVRDLLTSHLALLDNSQFVLALVG